jgi:hypothetical protein
MTLSGVFHYLSTTDTEGTKADIQLSTDKKTSEIFIAFSESKKNVLKYLLALTDFSLHKKMYQPTEIIAQVNITSASGKDKDYKSISRKVLEEMFKHAKVAVSEGNFNVGDKFYVFEVLPQYFEASMVVTLKIYSLDKLMTLNETSRTFVGKRLGADILKTEALNYVEPDDNMKESDAWVAANTNLIDKQNELKGDEKGIKDGKDGNDADAYEDAIQKELNYKKEIAALEQDLKNTTKYTGNAIKVNIENMKTLMYVDQNTNSSTNGFKCEHIHHYLVQYNESFYDMLARTCNRWGEFLYYENGELNLGYDDKKAPIDLTGTGFKSISFFDLNSKNLPASQKGKYELEADNSSLRGFSLEESPFIPKGQFGYTDERHKVDKWIMKQFPAIFKNDKNLPTMLTNIMFDNLFSLAMAKSSTAKLNSDADEKYFANYDEDTHDQHYGSFDFANAKKAEPKRLKNAYQEFSELYTNYNEKGYSIILQKELSVGEDAIHIDYETTFPKLKLGDIITYNGENFIVVEIKSRFDSKKGPVFEVVATAQDSKDKLFYPAIIPSGHVRYAHPQEATITDANDPTGFNRVRVLFNWQKEYIQYKDELNKPKGCVDDTVKLSTPWLTFASNQQGAPVTGYHYVGYPVMVGFVDGNVERPYVMGGISDDFVIADSVMQTEGGQRLQISDGFGNGMSAFLTGMFSPLLKTLTGFVPGIFPSWDWKKSRRFEGGFELTDYYGIYKVSGSTDGRNVTVASPWGDVKVNAFTGISISAPNGDVKISGKNVTIEAGNNLTLVSGTNVDYKLWKSKDTKGGTIAQIALDLSAQVAKKIAEIALSIVDLSLVRSTVEIFFRPVEGALTVKSNRYLKLEAGKNRCAYPDSAYNKEEKLKLLNEMNKSAIEETAGIGRGMIEVFNAIKPLTSNFFEKYRAIYNTNVSIMASVKSSLNALKLYSKTNTQNLLDMDKVIKAIWEQKEDKDWEEKDIPFKEEEIGIKDDDIPAECYNRGCSVPACTSGVVNSRKKKVLDQRKKYRAEILAKVNQLRKKVYELSHVGLTKIEVDTAFGHYFYQAMPKDFKSKMITVFSPEKTKEAIKYVFDQKLLNTIDQPFNDDSNEVVYFRRVMAMNLLKEFGFKDDLRRSVNGTDVPPVPDINDLDPGNPGGIMHTSTWRDYAASLNGVPPIGKDASTIGAALKKAVVGSAVDKFKNNWAALYYAAKERRTWGDGKNGEILFGAGKKTYALKDKNFKEIETLSPTIKSSADFDDKEKDAVESFLTDLRFVLYYF